MDTPPTISLEEFRTRGYLHDCICDWEWAPLPVSGSFWWMRTSASPDCSIHKGY